MWFLPKYPFLFRNDLFHIYFFIPKPLNIIYLLSSIHYPSYNLIGNSSLPIGIFLELYKSFSIKLFAFHSNFSHYIKRSLAKYDIRKSDIAFAGNIEIIILL